MCYEISLSGSNTYIIGVFFHINQISFKLHCVGHANLLIDLFEIHCV